MLNKNPNNDDNANDANLIRTADLDENDDDVCEAEAAQARRLGRQLVEDHLSHHMDQNPNSSYVTWIACLHPENAEVTIDERFFVANNPWWTAWEATKGGGGDHNLLLPTATATPVVPPQQPTSAKAAPDDAAAATATASGSSKAFDGAVSPAVNRPNDSGSGSRSKQEVEAAIGIDLVVGCILSLIAIGIVVGMETGAYILYVVSAGFYKLAQMLNPPNSNMVTGIFYSVCLLIYYTLNLVDSCLLLVSVLVTELVALTLFLLSCIFAGIQMAQRWHQYLRRTCHLIRWAYRSKSFSSHPPRHLCLVCLPHKLHENSSTDDEEDDPEEEAAAAAAVAALEQGDPPQQHPPQWLMVGESAGEVTVTADKENDWNDKKDALPGPRRMARSPTPTAPSSEEIHDVIVVLDESNVLVDHNDGHHHHYGGGNTIKKEYGVDSVSG